MTTDPNYAVEIAYTKGYCAYLISMNTSRWVSDKKIQYRVTTPNFTGAPVPPNAVKVNYGRALELAGILNKCGRIAKVVEVVSETSIVASK